MTNNFGMDYLFWRRWRWSWREWLADLRCGEFEPHPLRPKFRGVMQNRSSQREQVTAHDASARCMGRRTIVFAKAAGSLCVRATKVVFGHAVSAFYSTPGPWATGRRLYRIASTIRSGLFFLPNIVFIRKLDKI